MAAACSTRRDATCAIRQPGSSRTPPVPAPTEPTPEDRRIVAAYQREQDALVAPAGIRSGGGAASFSLLPGTGASLGSTDDLAQVAALSQSIAGRNATRT